MALYSMNPPRMVEVSSQRPMALVPGGISPKFDGEGRLEVLAGDLGGDDLEVDQQAFLVVHDARLGGGDPDVARRAVALVLDHHGQRVRHAGFDLGGERIIGEHVALVEVFHRETGAGEHGDRGRRQRHGELQPALAVAQDGRR